jgi:hypothetical protein
MGASTGSGFGPLGGQGAALSGDGVGPGWTALAATVATQVPPAEIESIFVFRPIKRDGREWGTAVVTRAGEAQASGVPRLRVYTARYMLVVRGKERGRSKVEVEEVALTPAEVIAQVMHATADRSGDPDPPAAIDRSTWFAG